jgi:hypothetical protein
MEYEILSDSLNLMALPSVSAIPPLPHQTPEIHSEAW